MIRWTLIHETNDLSNLFVKKVKCVNNKKLSSLWASIYDEYLIEFGLSDNYKEILELKKSIAIKKAEYIITSNKIIINFINVEEDKLKTILTDIVGGKTFKENIVSIEKIQGVKIDTKNITVSDYYNYLKNLSNG